MSEDDVIVLGEALEISGEELPEELLALESFLQRSVLFSALEPSSRHQLAEAAGYRREPPGTVIVKEGDLGDEFYLIKAGSLDVSTIAPNGDRLLLATLGPGSFFGEVAVLNRKPRTATVAAAEDVELFSFSRRDIEPILHSNPDVENKMRDLILLRSQDTIRKLDI